MRVELPFLAEGVEGGDVVQVLVHEGDQVTEGQSLIELETDKATVPVPAPAAGKITRLLVRQGDHLKVGQALVELEGADGEAQASKTSAPERPAIAPAPQPPPAVEAAHAHSVQQREGYKSEQPATEPVHAAPAVDRVQSAAATIAAPPSVRRLARELGVELTQVKGSEAGGRITAEDVKTYVRERTRRLGSPSSRDGNDKAGVFTTMYG
ncbi:MAG TPA: biotin/lipoyl-containing protein, partial [Nitrospira sp.]|nr:biotin/lipoyl-containing protein [Nitrospira sp.]